LLKAKLIELYELAGLTDDVEPMKKAEIIEAIVNARDDFASVPPSSPPGRTEGASSDCSSDDGHFAEDEETDAPASNHPLNGFPLKRRVTLHDVSKSPTRPVKSRSLSMGNLLGHGEPPKTFLKRKVSELDGSEKGTSRSACLFSVL